MNRISGDGFASADTKGLFGSATCEKRPKGSKGASCREMRGGTSERRRPISQEPEPPCVAAERSEMEKSRCRGRKAFGGGDSHGRPQSRQGC